MQLSQRSRILPLPFHHGGSGISDFRSEISGFNLSIKTLNRTFSQQE